MEWTIANEQGEAKMPEIIKTWKELILPAKVKIEWWDQLDTLDEPQYVKVKLDSGHVILIKREGHDIKTWRFK